MTMLPYLSLAIWVPIVSGLLVLAVHRDRDAAAARWLALVGSLAGFAVTIPLYTHFALGTSEMQFVEFKEWIPRFNVNYLLGVDGISLLLVLLNSFITVLVVWAGWIVIEKRVAQYMGISGGNFFVAETGSVVLVTNEGNATLTTTLPKVHIAISGIEKIVPTLEDVATLMRLLPRSATGQSISNYVDILTGVKGEGEFNGVQHMKPPVGLGQTKRRPGRRRPDVPRGVIL